MHRAGAPNADLGTTNTGGVYVFVKNGNTFEQKQVLLPFVQVWANCGDAVMMRGNHLIVSCPRANIGSMTYAGSVEVYRYNPATRNTAPFTWVQQLTSPVLAAFTYTGYAVGMNDEGTRLSFSNRGVSGVGMMVEYKLVNDKFVYESQIDGTVMNNYFGESAQYPVSSWSFLPIHLLLLE